MDLKRKGIKKLLELLGLRICQKKSDVMHGKLHLAIQPA